MPRHPSVLCSGEHKIWGHYKSVWDLEALRFYIFIFMFSKFERSNCYKLISYVGDSSWPLYRQYKLWVIWIEGSVLVPSGYLCMVPWWDSSSVRYWPRSEYALCRAYSVSIAKYRCRALTRNIRTIIPISIQPTSAWCHALGVYSVYQTLVFALYEREERQTAAMLDATNRNYQRRNGPKSFGTKFVW